MTDKVATKDKIRELNIIYHPINWPRRNSTSRRTNMPYSYLSDAGTYRSLLAPVSRLAVQKRVRAKPVHGHVDEGANLGGGAAALGVNDVDRQGLRLERVEHRLQTSGPQIRPDLIGQNARQSPAGLRGGDSGGNRRKRNLRSDRHRAARGKPPVVRRGDVTRRDDAVRGKIRWGPRPAVVRQVGVGGADNTAQRADTNRHKIGLRKGDHLVDPRIGGNGQHGMTGLFRQSTFGRLGGYEDVNDADRLGHDPAMRWIGGGRAVAKQAASASQMGRFETEFLATDDNIAALAELSGVWIDQVYDRKPPKGVVLDMDSSVSPTYGDQEGTAYNGHFGRTCYHPLFLFNHMGDLERCRLRPGNVHSAGGRAI